MPAEADTASMRAGEERASSAGEAEHARGQPDSATALSEACAEHERGCVPLRRASISSPLPRLRRPTFLK